MKTKLRSALALAAVAVATAASAQVRFYEHEDFRGRSFTTEKQVWNLDRWGFNDRASSAEVTGGTWEVCTEARFEGRCRILRPGNYPTLAAIGMNDRISSVREVDPSAAYEPDRYAPAPPPSPGYAAARDFRRRADEQLYEARVTDVRAVVETPDRQRCWVERDAIGYDRREASVPGAIAGGVIGGVLGHQIGGGSGRDAATALGAIAGLAIGSNAGRDRYQSAEVRRCDTVRSDARPDYWDVTYEFRGQVHHVLMTRPPGATVVVNSDGEPRVS